MALKSVARGVYKRARRFRSSLIERSGKRYLTSSMGEQMSTFERLAPRCAEYYQDLKGCDIGRFMTDAWVAYNERMEKIISPLPSPSFLRDQNVISAMFLCNDGTFFLNQLKYVESRLPEPELKRLLHEDVVGDPIIRSSKYMTSHNRIHHLYHLLKFKENTGVDIRSLRTAVEWGGGYGNMARLIDRINPGMTYVIVDAPLFSCIQWIYLASTLGESAVHFIRSSDDVIRPGKINILPLCFVEDYRIDADIFIATWSLSESSDYSVDFVRSRKFYNARHLLLAYQCSDASFPYADRVAHTAREWGATIKEFEPTPANYYAFK